jgi:L-lactate dehydrogenase complex protein LldG
MSATQSGVVDSFRDSLDRVSAAHSTTRPAEFEAALADVVEAPAVGAPLPFADLSLPASVETDPLPSDLEAAATGVTAARCAIADYGSVVLESTPDGVEQSSLFPDEHVAVVRAADVHPDMQSTFDALGPLLREGGSAIVATGPSATADMGDLVLGAHGPERVHVLIVEEER